MFCLLLACSSSPQPASPPPATPAPSAEPSAPATAPVLEQTVRRTSLRVRGEVVHGESSVERIMETLRPRLTELNACWWRAEPDEGPQESSFLTVAWGPAGEVVERFVEGGAELDAALRGCLKASVEGLTGPPGVTARYELRGEEGELSAPGGSDHPSGTGPLGAVLGQRLQPCASLLDPTGPGQRQRIQLLVHRDPDGRVEQVEPEFGSPPNEALRACVVQAVRGLSLPPAAGGTGEPERIPVLLARDEG